MARLGQLLVRADLVSENNLARALGIQHFAGGRLGTLLLERGSIDEDNLGKTLALQHGCEYIPWRVLADVSPVVIAALPAKFAIKHAAVPYERGENYLRLVLRDPGDLRILDELFFVTGRKIIAGVAPEVRIYQALEKYYGERRTPRYAILAEKLSRPLRASRSASNAPPPPPDFFPSPPRKPPPPPQEVWGDAAEQEVAEPPIIQSWKVPDQRIGGWAGTVSPGFDVPTAKEPETISWEEMPAIPSLWMPEPVATSSPPAPALPAAEETQAAGGALPLATPSAPIAPSIFSFPAAAPPLPPPPREIDVSAPAPRAEPGVSPLTAEIAVPAPAESAAVFPATAAKPLPTPATPPVAEPGVPFVAASEPQPEPARVPAAAEPPWPATGAEPAPPLPAPQEPVASSPAGSAAPVPAPPPHAAPPASAAAASSTTDFPEVASATDPDSIAGAALAALARRFLRGAVFIAKPDGVTAWGAAGNGISPEEVRDIAIPWKEPSIFLNARHSRTIYLGPLPPLPRHEAIAVAMGGWPDECLLQPILIKERPVAFLYAEFTQDQGATPMDLAYMRELAVAASSAFVSAIRLKKKEI